MHGHGEYLGDGIRVATMWATRTQTTKAISFGDSPTLSI